MTRGKPLGTHKKARECAINTAERLPLRYPLTVSLNSFVI